jgi:hypothetical protein
MRTMRRLLPVVIVLAIVVALVLVLTSRPSLQDARDDVDTTWDVAAPRLNERFVLLTGATQAVLNTPGPTGAIAKDVDAALKRWVETQEANDRDAAIDTANDLDGLGRRLVNVVRSSPRLSADPNVTGPVDAYATAAANAAPPAELAAFADAVRAYEQERQGPVRGVVADVFGYEAVPTLAVTPAA